MGSSLRSEWRPGRGASGAGAGDSLREYYARLQSALHLLYRALDAGGRAQPWHCRSGIRMPGTGGARRARDNVAGTNRDQLRQTRNTVAQWAFSICAITGSGAQARGIAPHPVYLAAPQRLWRGPGGGLWAAAQTG